MTEQSWYPEELHKALLPAAFTTDLIRRDADVLLPDNGAGICLAASGVVSFGMIQDGIAHRLTRGEYKTSDGLKHPHWWIESYEFIFDSSRGQFDSGDSIVSSLDSQYYKAEEFAPGHSTEELLYQEALRSFSHPDQAWAWLQTALQAREESYTLVGSLN